MLKFIIRLDDACPTMNQEKWDKMEKLLDKYDIKPIVGMIPDNEDEEFCYEEIPDFWENYAQKWQKKNWIIALHGLHHQYTVWKNRKTEYRGKSYEEQKQMLEKGYYILLEKGITPTCFFAPNHTFDKNTIKACRDLKYFKFISDGIALYPYRELDMLFLPNIFDTPHKISKEGIFTFVYHPNKMKEEQFEYLEEFIKQYQENFVVNLDEILEKYHHRKKDWKDRIVEMLMKISRFMRGVKR